eukprot:17260-Heterococcus_DN1.PRE.2
MKESGVQPNVITYTAALNACGKVRTDTHTYSTAYPYISVTHVPGPIASGSDACLPLAHQSATVLTVQQCPTVYALCLHSMLHYCSAGQVDEALALLADMQHLGLKPSLITYGSALTACSTAGRGEQALALLQQMQHSNGLLPDARCYSAVISALGKAGMWREALQLLTAMQQPLTLTVVQPLGTTVANGRNGKTGSDATAATAGATAAAGGGAATGA